MKLPHARTENMLVERLADETLVYDVERNNAHSLRPLAAMVWSLSDGATDPAALAAAARRAGFAADEQLVSLALDELGRAGLVTDWERRVVSRRALLWSVALLVGVATMAAPDIGDAY